MFTVVVMVPCKCGVARSWSPSPNQASLTFRRASREANSPALTSPGCCCRTPSPSAWMAEVHGVTTCSLNGSGARSNTKRCTCAPMTASVTHAPRSGGIWTSTTASVRTRALTHARPTEPTSTACHWSRQHEFRRRWGRRAGRAAPSLRDAPQRQPTSTAGRRSIYRKRNAVQIRDLCRICGIPFAEFQKEERFINELLLGRRNKIAHGEEIYPGESEIDSLVDRLVNIMRLFRNLLENKVYDLSYLVESEVPRVS